MEYFGNHFCLQLENSGSYYPIFGKPFPLHRQIAFRQQINNPVWVLSEHSDFSKGLSFN
jgi:hypothetical protein